MLNLKCKIKVVGKDNKNIEFDYVNSMEIKTSRSNLTDTATIKLPKKMRHKGKALTEYVKKEDSITIQMGYEEHGIETVFTGYITGIKTESTATTSLLNDLMGSKMTGNFTAFGVPFIVHINQLML